MDQDDTVEWLNRTFLERFRGDSRYFGDPDGGRADLDDFVDVSEIRRSAFFSPDTGRVRVVLGRKGSGKTLYLRRLAAEIRNNRSTILADKTAESDAVVDESEQTKLLTSEHVIRIAHNASSHSLTEVWQQLWGHAILAASATHIMRDPRLRPYLDESQRAALASDFAPLLGKKVAAARSPFTTIKQMIDRIRSPRDLAKQLSDPLWDDLETRLGDLLSKCPPIYFIIDTIDEEFGHAPSYWARCQKGLFYESMRLMRNRRLGSKLLVIISIRDMVYHSVFQSEHASRYVSDPHMRILDWSLDAATAFLTAKVRRIPAYLHTSKEVPATLGEWLGFDSITNSLGKEEVVESYALRHTQCLPRDVVALGNLLGLGIDSARQQGKQFTPEDFKSVVSDLATLSGHVQLGVAANQVVADEIPLEATRWDFTDSYLSVNEYRQDRLDGLKGIIGDCRTLRFSHETLLNLQAAGRDVFEAPDVASILWQVGLLGVCLDDRTKPVFFSFDRLGRLRIPDNAHQYVFHPSMREVAGLLPGNG